MVTSISNFEFSELEFLPFAINKYRIAIAATHNALHRKNIDNYWLNAIWNNLNTLSAQDMRPTLTI